MEIKIVKQIHCCHGYYYYCDDNSFYFSGYKNKELCQKEHFESEKELMLDIKRYCGDMYGEWEYPDNKYIRINKKTQRLEKLESTKELIEESMLQVDEMIKQLKREHDGIILDEIIGGKNNE